MFGRLLGQLSVLVPCCPATIFALFYVQMNDWLTDWRVIPEICLHTDTQTRISRYSAYRVRRNNLLHHEHGMFPGEYIRRWFSHSLHVTPCCDVPRDTTDATPNDCLQDIRTRSRQDKKLCDVRSQTDRATWRLSRIIANCCITLRPVFVEGVGVEPPPPRKFLTPLLLLKNARGIDFLCTYALARSSTSIAKTSTPPNEIWQIQPR